MSYRGNRGGYRNQNQNNFANRISAQATIEIRNWEGGTLDDLIGFIQRKSSIRLQNSIVSGPVVTAKVTPDQATILQKYSGIRFAGNVLRIQIVDSGLDSSPPSESSAGIKEMLTRFLQSRYNAQLKLLDLQNLESDAFLRENHLFESASTSKKMFPALMKIATEAISSHNITVESVNLAANSLPDVTLVTTLSQVYPNLKNLSLANNNITDVRNLESWRHKFRQLRELILSGNPISTQPSYKDDIMKLFPKLIMLDGQVIRDEAAVNRLMLPVPVKQMFFENTEIQNVATNFLTNFFPLFDTDRDQLLQLYDDVSTFSISVNSSSPRALYVEDKSTTRTGLSAARNSYPVVGWSAYIPLSRNLQKVTNDNARVSRLSVGPQAIQNSFKRIPATKHELMSSPEKFSVESWRTTGVRSTDDTGIVISIHGEYTETRGEVLRSFDRTFILIQSANGSMIVASDIMAVRPWAGSDSWKEKPIQLQTQQQQQQQQTSLHPPPAPTINPTNPTVIPPIITTTPAASTPTPPLNTPSSIPPELANLTPQQLSIVQQLMQETRLNPQYSRMLAEQANFDLNQAAILFQQSRQQLPPSAFI